MSSFRSSLAALVFAAVALVAVVVQAQPADLPPENVRLKAAELPGYSLAQQKCGICHSADYVAYQPPGMSQAQWTAEAAKMQHAYGAPIDDAQVQQIGAYLAVAYGDAKGAQPTAEPVRVADAGAALDAKELLDANGCLGCHQIATRLVGPAYRDVAARYKADAGAQGALEASIRKGSVGRWGPTPMPGFANLTDEQAKALARFVLAQ